MNHNKLIATGLILAVSTFFVAGCIGGEEGNKTAGEKENQVNQVNLTDTMSGEEKTFTGVNLPLNKSEATQIVKEISSSENYLVEVNKTEKGWKGTFYLEKNDSSQGEIITINEEEKSYSIQDWTEIQTN